MSENQESEAPLDLGIEGVNGRVEIRDGKTYWMGTLVHPCQKCGIAVTNVDDCGYFGDPECPRFGIGREEFERRELSREGISIEGLSNAGDRPCI